ERGTLGQAGERLVSVWVLELIKPAIVVACQHRKTKRGQHGFAPRFRNMGEDAAVAMGNHGTSGGLGACAMGEVTGNRAPSTAFQWGWRREPPGGPGSPRTQAPPPACPRGRRHRSIGGPRAGA